MVSPVGRVGEVVRLLGQDALGELLDRLRRGFHCSWTWACREDEDGRCEESRLAIASDARGGRGSRRETENATTAARAVDVKVTRECGCDDLD